MSNAAKSCFFIGHRYADERIYEKILAAVDTHISAYGVTDFLVGHYGDFDRMAAQAVAETRHAHPGISLSGAFCAAIDRVGSASAFNACKTLLHVEKQIGCTGPHTARPAAH